MATLKARLREGTGKSVTRKLRAAGDIPAVAYGHGKEGQALTVNGHELELLLATINPENTIIDLRVEGSRPTPALIREVQRHPSRPFILHVDFFQIRAGEKLHVDVPVRLQGVPAAVRDGTAVLQEILRELSVECLPKDIPSSIDIAVEQLEVGESIHVSDIHVDNATILNDAELVVCSVTMPSVAELPEDTVAEEAEEAEGEPEVLRGRREDEGDSSDQGSTRSE